MVPLTAGDGDNLEGITLRLSDHFKTCRQGGLLERFPLGSIIPYANVLSLIHICGKISPSDKVSVTSGSNKTFTITANAGYMISDVLVDGESCLLYTSRCV